MEDGIKEGCMGVTGVFGRGVGLRLTVKCDFVFKNCVEEIVVLLLVE